MGHFCRICKRIRPNEQFSGRGHRIHVCKKCKQKPREERRRIEQLDELYGFLDQSNISAENIKRLKALCQAADDQVRDLAILVEEVDMEKSLREALALLGSKANQINVRPVWEKHLHTLVPTPGGSGSYYRDSALGMKALSEVYRASYDTLLSQWKTEFRRRRNL